MFLFGKLLGYLVGFFCRETLRIFRSRWLRPGELDVIGNWNFGRWTMVTNFLGYFMIFHHFINGWCKSWWDKLWSLTLEKRGVTYQKFGQDLIFLYWMEPEIAWRLRIWIDGTSQRNWWLYKERTGIFWKNQYFQTVIFDPIHLSILGPQIAWLVVSCKQTGGGRWRKGAGEPGEKRKIWEAKGWSGDTGWDWSRLIHRESTGGVGW